MELRAPPIDRLVVGLGDASTDAGVLAWATREAAVRQCSLRVLTTCGGDSNTFLDDAGDATLLIAGNKPIARTGRRGSCPLVVVRGTPRDHLRRIVVGVDSSNASAAALEWAMAEATRHEAAVTIVHAWEHTYDYGRSLRSNDLRRADAQCVADLAGDLYESGPTRQIERQAIHGSPADVLVAASANADLLVVGSRGRSGYRTLQFGSVTLAAIKLSDCPVVIVHPRLVTSGSGDPSDSNRAWR